MSSKEQQLYVAVERNVVPLVLSLLKEPHLEPNWVSYATGRTPLHHACELGIPQIIEALLRHPLIMVNKPDKHGMTPLGFAVKERNLGAVILLLEDPRVDPNIPDDRNRTPLFLAASLCSLEMVQWILVSKEVNSLKCHKKDEGSELSELSPADVALHRAKATRGPTESDKDYESRTTDARAISNLILAYRASPQATRDTLLKSPAIRGDSHPPTTHPH